MHKTRTKKTSFSWLTFIVIALLLISIIITIYFIFTYNAIQKSKHTGFDDTKQIVFNETEINHIEQIVRFQEMDEYHIVFGQDKDNIDHMLFIPITNRDEEITIIKQADIMNKDDVKEQWLTRCEQCKFISIKPAMLSHTPLWELTYYDESNRFVFDYVSIYDGSEFEKVLYQRKFK